MARRNLHHCENSRIVIPLLTPAWQKSERILPILLRGDWQQVTTPPLARYQLDAINLETATESDWQTRIARLRHYAIEPRPVKDSSTRRTLLKHRPIDHFVGRDQTLVDIHEKLCLDRLTALTHASVIAMPALGGVGKTTLARHYAEKLWRFYRRMFWIDCRTGIEAGFADIYDLLHPGHEQSVPWTSAPNGHSTSWQPPTGSQSMKVISP
jgi:hypothetical protein